MSNLPSEMSFKSSGCVIDIYNNKGCVKLFDAYLSHTPTIFSFNLDTDTGRLKISCGEKNVQLGEFEVEMLIRFLQQKD